ncbi:MAG: peptidylprolyl isomerase, partial [Clostridia bacterium]|nr:peptidylprolyl isomerase [Clostridia bacterium]
MVQIEMENGGIIKVELDKTAAPVTAANFERLVKEGFYDGLIFHRVIKGFMIQGGGYTEEMEHKETESIKGEFKANGFM